MGPPIRFGVCPHIKQWALTTRCSQQRTFQKGVTPTLDSKKEHKSARNQSKLKPHDFASSQPKPFQTKQYKTTTQYLTLLYRANPLSPPSNSIYTRPGCTRHIQLQPRTFEQRLHAPRCQASLSSQPSLYLLPRENLDAIEPHLSAGLESVKLLPPLDSSTDQ